MIVKHVKPYSSQPCGRCSNITMLARSESPSVPTAQSVIKPKNRVIQSCHLLANYRGTYFPTYSIMKSRRSAISGIMNFVDDYSYCPTYCVTYCSAYPPLPFCIQTPNVFFFFFTSLNPFTFCPSPRCLLLPFHPLPFVCPFSHPSHLPWVNQRNPRLQNPPQSPTRILEENELDVHAERLLPPGPARPRNLKPALTKLRLFPLSKSQRV
jgi:hypothetical protein